MIKIVDLKEIINDSKITSNKINKIKKLKQKIIDIMDNGQEAYGKFLKHNYMDSTTFDFLVYYLDEYL